MVHTEPVMPAPSNSNGAAPDRLWRYFGVALLLIGIAFSSVTSVDRFAETEYQALFQRALVTFALARTLNGVISAVQGTELALQPAGVGVTLTPGEILDPVNDLVIVMTRNSGGPKFGEYHGRFVKTVAECIAK